MVYIKLLSSCRYPRERLYFRRYVRASFLQVEVVLHRNKVSEFKLERICRDAVFSLWRRVRYRVCVSHGYK